MSYNEVVSGIESSGVGEWMRSSLKAMPVVESLHVLAIAIVFGTILLVDLRLLGVRDVDRPVRRMTGELLAYTWVAFGVAVVTGAMMFAANASTYIDNTAFLVKMLVIVVAGLNMAYFQVVTFKSVDAWNTGVTPPLAARVAGGLSIALWTTVIFLGRWIGFTKGYDFTLPDDIDIDFDFGYLEVGLSWFV